MAFVTGTRGGYSSHVGHARVGIADGRSSMVVEGDNYGAGKGGNAAASPLAYVPASLAALFESWHFSHDPVGIVSCGGSTDGTANEWFQTLTNSGTITTLATAAGMEGNCLSTTGATNGNQNAFIATPSHKSTTNRIAVMMGNFIFPAQTGHLSSIYFGFGNKQADPKGTAFTDGCWFEGVGSGTTCQFTTKTRSASGTATTTALASGGLLAAATATSIQLALVMIGQVRTLFYLRDPSTATNPWVLGANVTTTLPAATVLLRPHFVHYGDSGSAAQAVNFRTPSYWFEKATTF